MRALRPLLLALGLALALVAAGCGSSGSDSQGAGSGGAIAGAANAPADALAIVAIDTETTGAQWQRARELLARFPSGGKLIDQVQAELAKDGLSWESDVKPALGPEVDIVVIDTPTGPELVGLTQSPDKAKFEAVIAADKSSPSVTAEIDGWSAVADSQAILDAYEQARAAGTLDGSDAYAEATAGLSPDALVSVYVNGSVVSAVAKSSASELGGLSGLAGPGALGAGLDWASGTVTLTPDGVKLDALVKRSGGAGLSQYTPELVSELPSGALAVFSFSNLEQPLNQFLDTLGQQDDAFDQQLSQVELALGLSVRNDLLPLFGGEGALAFYPGSPIPTVSLVLSVDDTEKAVATVDQLVAAAGAFAGLAGGGSGLVPSQTDVDGVPARELKFGGFSLFYAGFDGKLVLTTSREGISGLRSAGSKLADDPDFTAARDAAGAPGETAGFAYVNVSKVTDFVATLAQLGGSDVPDEAVENLRHVHGAFVWAGEKDGLVTVSGFVGVK
jgi:hypothetical protein